MLSRRRRAFRRAGANDNDALIPEIWAKFALPVLQSNIVVGSLVHRDFEQTLQNFGDVVNTRKPASFTAIRKTDVDDVTVQDATVTNVPVALNMHPHVSFLIRDGEESLAFESLVEQYLEPAMKAMAEHIDRCILGQYPRFLIPGGVGGQTYGNVGGRLGGLTSANYQQYLTEAAEALDVAKCPADGRQIIVPPSMKRLILQNQTLVGANQRGDEGTALRTADMGDIYGFRHFMCQNMASFSTAEDNEVDVAGAINNAAGYPKGTSVLTVDGIVGALVLGIWCKLNGKPYQVTAKVDAAGNTTQITISPPLREAVVDNDVITFYGQGAINLAAGYAVGWAKALAVDGFTTAFPAVGQAVTFKAAADVANVYTVIAADSVAGTITLDRPLVAALVDNDVINVAPPGDYALAFHKNAIALVIRPLKPPRAGAGAIAGTAEHNGFAVRVVISYDATKQGHLVTIDSLMGVAVLDKSYGGVLLG